MMTICYRHTVQQQRGGEGEGGGGVEAVNDRTTLRCRSRAVGLEIKKEDVEDRFI